MDRFYYLFFLSLFAMIGINIVILKKNRYFMQISYSRISLVVITVALFFLSLWLKQNFGQFKIDSLIGLSYLSISGIEPLVNLWLKQLFLFLVVYTFFGSIMILFFDQCWKKSQAMMKICPYFCYQHYLKFACILILAVLGHQSQVWDYLYYQFYRVFPQQHDRFRENYLDPRHVSFAVNRPKNLLLIYVESLEKTYTSPQLFKKNLLQALSQQKYAQHFEEFGQMPGADWSLGGLIASQCGLPVRVMGQTILARNLFGRNRKDILPGAWCLSDILATHAYHNVYMNGQSVKFAGFDHFLRSHHYHEIYGRQELSQVLPQTELSVWGLPDDVLFVQAQKKLNELMQMHQPFNLTLFTIDTHGVDGHINRSCQQAGVHDFPGIVECSANLVARFIEYVQAQPWSKEVLIVVLGDHLAMKNKVSVVLAQAEPRYIFNSILNTDLVKNRDLIFHVDWLPTILKGLGFEYAGTQLGLGYSAIGPQPSLPRQRLDLLKQIYLYPSPYYDVLWSRKE